MTATSAQRYNARLARIFARAKELQIVCLGCHKLYHHKLTVCPLCGNKKSRPWS